MLHKVYHALGTLAVALASAGRGTDALLEAIDALARAREATDARGEFACLHFLGRLCADSGAVEAAALWSAAGRELVQP